LEKENVDKRWFVNRIMEVCIRESLCMLCPYDVSQLSIKWNSSMNISQFSNSLNDIGFEFVQINEAKNRFDKNILHPLIMQRYLREVREVGLNYWSDEYFNESTTNGYSYERMFLEYNLWKNRWYELKKDDTYSFVEFDTTWNCNIIEASKLYIDQMEKALRVKFILSKSVNADFNFDVYVNNTMYVYNKWGPNVSKKFGSPENVCDKIKNKYKDKTIEFWSGTAPFCGAEFGDCERIGSEGLFNSVSYSALTEYERDNPGGSKCWTGKKVLCRMNPKRLTDLPEFKDLAKTGIEIKGEYQLKWYGTAPLCDANACDAILDGYIPLLSDRQGDGSFCMTGQKILGIKPEKMTPEAQEKFNEMKKECERAAMAASQQKSDIIGGIFKTVSTIIPMLI
jgi:hypothetical protein